MQNIFSISYILNLKFHISDHANVYRRETPFFSRHSNFGDAFRLLSSYYHKGQGIPSHENQMGMGIRIKNRTVYDSQINSESLEYPLMIRSDVFLDHHFKKKCFILRSHA